MRVVFMGTPGLAATVLGIVARHHQVVGVFTRPDAVRGRGKKLIASEVKVLAEQLGIPVYTPKTMRDAEALDTLRRLAPDAACVSAYGVILPKDALDIPRFGCLNVHTSLLPRWRGAAPIQRAILEGDAETGVSIMRMAEGLDTGDYCVRRTVSVGEATTAELTDVLARKGAEALLEALDLVESGEVVWTKQGNAGVTYAAKIGKGELNPSPDDTAQAFVAKVRASSTAHPARAIIAGRSLAVEQARIVEDAQAVMACEGMEVGDARFSSKRLFARVSDGIVEIERVRPDGKKSMEAKAFAGGIQGIKTASIRLERC